MITADGCCASGGADLSFVTSIFCAWWRNGMMGVDLVSLPRNGPTKTVVDQMIYGRVASRRRRSSFVYFSAFMNYVLISTLVLSVLLLV